MQCSENSFAYLPTLFCGDISGNKQLFLPYKKLFYHTGVTDLFIHFSAWPQSRQTDEIKFGNSHNVNSQDQTVLRLTKY